MAGREQPYDPYITPGSSRPSGKAQYEGGKSNIPAIQEVGGFVSIPLSKRVSENLRRGRLRRVSVKQVLRGSNDTWVIKRATGCLA